MRKKLVTYLVNYYLWSLLFYWLLAIGYFSTVNVTANFYQWAFFVTAGLGHMGLLAIVPGLLLMLLLAIILPFKRLIITLNILVSSVFLIFLIVDMVIYKMFHMHMNFFILKVMFGEGGGRVLDLSLGEYIIIAAIFTFIIATQCLLSYFLVRKVIKEGRVKHSPRRYLTVFVVFICLAGVSNIIRAWAAATFISPVLMTAEVLPLYGRLTANKFFMRHHMITREELVANQKRAHLSSLSTKSLHYPRHPLRFEPKSKYPNIVVIFIDALRANMFSKVVTPHIYQFSKNAMVFSPHISGGNETKAGVFSFFYAMPSNNFDITFNEHKPPLFFDILRQKHYDIDIDISGMSITMPPFYGNVYADIPHLRVITPGANPWQRDEFVTKHAISFLKKPHKHPFFMFAFYASTHGYSFPIQKAHFKPWKTHNVFLALRAKDRMPYINAYRNAAYFDDRQANQLLTTLKTQGLLDNTIVIISADHGEEFNDNHQGHWGHGSDFTPIQTDVPLIIYWPGHKAKDYNYVTTHYDVLPTLMKYVFGVENPMSDYTVGHDLFSKVNRYPICIGDFQSQAIVTPTKSIVLEFGGLGLYNVFDNHAKRLAHCKVGMNILRDGFNELHHFDFSS